MKKALLLFSLMMGTLATNANDYSYLTFETTDGAKVSVSASSLTITQSGTTLTAGSQSFVLSNLSKMYFSNSDLTTGIEKLTVSDWNEVTEIYDLKGQKVTKEQMRKGAYIVQSKRGTFKFVKK